ncbi:MAG: tetratricopeptide repeat protein [Nitrospirae bacterium]|nr:tetratricopeptide repeat protein [Nitrospirota bacterium]MCL5237831.1 tetratricopeptide repeat protein [Nitrospirota bacterium]
MKKLIIAALLIIIAAGCQQKQEPKGQPQFPGQGPAGAPQHAQEIGMLQEALKKNPHDVKTWIQLGNIMMDTSRFKEAADAYGNALSLDPKNVDVRVDLGTCLRSMGKPDLAAQEYRKALETNPNHANAHRNLGVVLAFDFKDKARAIKEFDKYLALAPNAPDAGQIKQMVSELKK